MSITDNTNTVFAITHARMGGCGTFEARTETEALAAHWRDAGYAVGYDADTDELTGLDALDIYSDADAIDPWEGYTVERVEAD